MWIDKIKYRDKLDLNKDVTFGVEIEFADARKRYVNESLEKGYNNKFISNKWDVKYEETIYKKMEDSHIYGGEAISDILVDNPNTWHDIKYACDKIKLFSGNINENCGAHVHVGANILNDNIKYYDRLMKLWIIYEDVILRFCLGEYNYPRKSLYYFAASPYTFFKVFYDNFYQNNKLNITYDQFIRGLGGCKNLALSFRGLDEDYLKRKYKDDSNWYKYRTLEFRAGNGTLNPVIWQNYINLYTKLLLCCSDDNKDWDMIDRRFSDEILNEDLNNFDYSKAEELCNFVFDNEIDKYNFMLQYIKDEDYNIDKPKARKKIL